MRMWTPMSLLSLETWILFITIIALAWYYVHRKWQYLQELNIPHDPPSISRLGHMRDSFSKVNAFNYDNDMKKKHGPIWGSYTLLSPGITIHDPDIIRQIFIKEFHAFPIKRKSFTKILGKELNQSLGSTRGKQWKRLRASLSPTFSSAKLRQMSYIMDRCADNAVRYLNRKIESHSGIFNVRQFFSRLSIDIICSAAFSTEVNSLDETIAEPEISKRARQLSNGSFFNPMILLCLLFPPFERVLEYFDYSLFSRESIEYFKALVLHTIRQREVDSTLEKRRVDLLQLMLDDEISEKDAKSDRLEKGMNRNEIIGNSMLMIIAGEGSTSNIMNFLIYTLAQYPDLQRKVQDEVDATIKNKETFDYDSVAELKYLEMCINECLRFYNPVLRNSRVCENEVTINGLTIPKGVSVNIPAYALSHDPEYWDEPEVFKPERMRDMTQIDPMLHQAFGHGPRNCIGQRFAMLSMKLCLAKLLHNFTFMPADDTPKPPLKLRPFGATLRCVADYSLKVIRRNREE